MNGDMSNKYFSQTLFDSVEENPTKFDADPCWPGGDQGWGPVPGLSLLNNRLLPDICTPVNDTLPQSGQSGQQRWCVKLLQSRLPSVRPATTLCSFN